MPYKNDLWNNEHLLKDVGLVPYYFHKLYNYSTTIVSKNHSPYPYLDYYFHDTTLTFIDDESLESHKNFIKSHAKDYHLLILIGAFSSNLEFAKIYKASNPLGKVYLQLDMNSFFAEWLFYAVPDILEFDKYCDVIATSGRKIQSLLNRKTPWNVEYIPNGFFDYLFPNKPFVFSEKENWITTVGRLGSNRKNTELLVDAFSRISHLIPSWELHLVGSTTDAFEKHIDDLLASIPSLEGKLIRHGKIEDKNGLINIYSKTKIFALSSKSEGGCPNVISEALRSGCVIATTSFDCAEDAINNGLCGKIAPSNDISLYASMLYELCTEIDLEEMSNNCYKYALRNFDYNKIIKRLHHMLFEETPKCQVCN